MALAMLLAIACGRERAAPTAAPQPSLEITLDDAPPRRVEVTGKVALSSLIDAPAPTWQEVLAASADSRFLELHQPTTTYPDAEVRIYIDQNRPALGVFRRVTSDMPPEIAQIARQPVASLVDVRTIEVRTRPRPLPPLVIATGGTDHPVADRLRDLAKAPATTPRERGWALGDVVALVVPRDRAITSVRLHAQGAIVPVDVKALGESRALLKQNQRGEYVFRMWDTARGAPSTDVRGVTKIEIE